MEIARRSFVIDHFHVDPGLQRDRCDELYAQWVSTQLKEQGCATFVAVESDRPIGLITCALQRVDADWRYGTIDLVAVEQKMQGKGVVSSLIARGLEWFSRHTTSVYVGTQAANISAVRMYERSGFRHVYSEATLRLWLCR
jgi:GNAT superfamily N-acetyltransferase